MTQAIERTRPQRSGIRQFGDLPPATSSMNLDRALELAGVDEPELVLLASTTFKECSSMEELITLIATVRRRGLDPMLKQVYYERFGGESSGPSLHIGIDGLRTIAVKTGRYVGAGEPRFSDVYDLPVDDRGATKPVPAKCVVTVFANNGGRVGAFDGVAFMDECYPGTGARGRMWRARPRSMLAIAAERQALRRAFPSETGGLADLDEGEQAVGTVVIERAQEHASTEPTRDDMDIVRSADERIWKRYQQLLGDARSLGLNPTPVTLPFPREMLKVSGSQLVESIEHRKDQLDQEEAARSAFVAHTNERGETIHMPRAEDERAAEIVEQAHAAAEQRDQDLDAIEQQRQRVSEGLL